MRSDVHAFPFHEFIDGQWCQHEVLVFNGHHWLAIRTPLWKGKMMAGEEQTNEKWKRMTARPNQSTLWFLCLVLMPSLFSFIHWFLFFMTAIVYGHPHRFFLAFELFFHWLVYKKEKKRTSQRMKEKVRPRELRIVTVHN